MLQRTDNNASLAGDLTVDETPELYRKSLAWQSSSMPVSIDLTELNKTDSSAVALLLEWSNWARQQNQNIEFLNPPDNLRTIAALSQVDTLLGWTSEEER